jgi:L-ascorbate metabolism protein UlaG (beta-lactamase superfamily)
VRLTHVGGPTLLVETGGWRLLTDPTFDPPGRRYDFGWGTSSRKLTGPALTVEQLGRVDAVLLTHDHHGDNLDDAGRAVLGTAPTVLTTVPAAERLSRAGLVDPRAVVGLHPWSTTVLAAPGRSSLEVTATPCRHGPPLSRPVVGDVVGFAVTPPGQADRGLWISGDTVPCRGVREAARRLRVDTAVLHLGGVRFPVTGPLRYTMTARDVVRLCRTLTARTIVPVHYEGWAHFREGRAAVERVLDRAPGSTARRVRWLEPGVPTDTGSPRE